MAAEANQWHHMPPPPPPMPRQNQLLFNSSLSGGRPTSPQSLQLLQRQATSPTLSQPPQPSFAVTAPSPSHSVGPFDFSKTNVPNSMSKSMSWSENLNPEATKVELRRQPPRPNSALRSGGIYNFPTAASSPNTSPQHKSTFATLPKLASKQQNSSSGGILMRPTLASLSLSMWLLKGSV